MRCEVVAIGTELLLGIIHDTNSSWIGEQLALSGIDSYYQVKVGDNFDRMEATIRTALERSDAVICCGGLGPTQDDITRDVIAKIMGVPMVRNDEIADEIARRFAARGRTMSANNLRQADVPVGAQPIEQMPGTAPGLVCPIGEKVVYLVPGVPSEMRMMMEGTILPDLRERAGEASVIRSRVLRCWGISESGLAEMLNDRVEALDETGDATIAFQASGIEGIKVRITAKADTEAAAMTRVEREEALIRPVLTDAVFGIDDETMEIAVLNALRERGQTVAAVEEITGGILASRMTITDPEMQTFRGSSVLSNGAMPVAATTGGFDERVMALAAKARDDHGADVGMAAIAPGPGEGLAPGTVFMALAIGDETMADMVVLFPDRSRMRSFAVISLLDYLRKTLAVA